MKAFIEIVLKMSVYGSIAILLVILLRSIFRKVPKKAVVLLWIVAAVRLVCPLNIGTPVSLFNLAPQGVIENLRPMTILDFGNNDPSEALDAYAPGTGISGAKNAEITTGNSVTGEANPAPDGSLEVNPSVSDTAPNLTEDAAIGIPTGDPGISLTANGSPAHIPAGESVSTVAFVIWLAGAAVIVLFVAISVIRTKRVLSRHFKRSDRYMESDAISTPFVIGFINPKICVPSEIDVSEKDYMLLHEQIHVKKHDALIKSFALIVLCVHWFNPLVWLAFRLCMSDLEMRCDEEVIDILGDRIRKDYCLSIVNHAAADDNFRVFTTAFAKRSIGRMEIKMRIKNLINYKKMSKLTTVTVLIIALVATFVLTSCAQDIVPDLEQDKQNRTLSYTHEQINYRLYAGGETFGYGPDKVVTDSSYRFFYNEEAIPSFDILKPNSIASVTSDEDNLMIKAESFDYVGDIKLSIINTKTNEAKTDVIRGPVLTQSLWSESLDTCKVVTPNGTSEYIKANEKLMEDIDKDGFPFGCYDGSKSAKNVLPDSVTTHQNVRIAEESLLGDNYGKTLFPSDFVRPAEKAFDPIYVNELVRPVEINIEDYPKCLAMACSQEEYVTYIIYNYSEDSAYDGVVLANTSVYGQYPPDEDSVLTIKTSSNHEDYAIVDMESNIKPNVTYIPVSATFDSFDEFRSMYSPENAKDVLAGKCDTTDPRISSIPWDRLKDDGPDVSTEYMNKADYYLLHRFFKEDKTQFYILYSIENRTVAYFEFVPKQIVTKGKIGVRFDSFEDFKFFYSAENLKNVLAGAYDKDDPRVTIVSWSHFAESGEGMVTDYINNSEHYILHRKGADGKTLFSLTYFPSTNSIVRLEFI